MLGRNVDDVASEIGSSVETVRTHVRRILSKTGTTRQGELISLILRISPFRKSFDTGTSTPAKKLPAHEDRPFFKSRQNQ